MTSSLSPERPDVCVVGLGYIGLPTSVVLAESGLRVLGVDIRDDIVAALNQGKVVLSEEGLAARAHAVVEQGRLAAATRPVPSRAFLIAVPTPVTPDHRPDMRFVWSAADSVAPVLQPGDLVILESTSPVGSTEEMAHRILKARPDLTIGDQAPAGRRIHAAYCPERIIPGNMFHELVHNDRIVGGIDEASTALAAALYRRFVRGQVHEGSARLAEACKLVENAFRDVNIAFANEVSMVCERLGVDVWQLRAIANRHPRVKILAPGPGVGGHCIPVDPWFLVAAAPDITPLMRTAREVNLAKTSHVLTQARALMQAQPKAKVALLGLAYKADTSDFRESPAMEIAKALAADGTHDLLLVEPSLRELPPSLARPGCALRPLQSAVRDAGIVVLLTGHRELRDLDAGWLAGKVVLDTQGVWQCRLDPATPVANPVAARGA